MFHNNIQKTNFKLPSWSSFVYFAAIFHYGENEYIRLKKKKKQWQK